QRERIAPEPVTCEEPALEVDAPHVIGRLAAGERRRHTNGSRLPPPPTRPRQPTPLEDLRDHASTRHPCAGIALDEARVQLARPPLRVLLTGHDDQILDLR